MSHPVKLVVADDLQRTRASVFFRLLLAIPHFVWLLLWGIAALVVVLLNWLVTLFRATPPQALHGFLSSYLRYAVHVSAYVNLLANPYPSFGGGDYAVDLRIAPPARQNRWSVAFRALLAIPALLLAAALAGSYGEAQGSVGAGGLLLTVAFLGWFAALVRGRMPHGLRDAGAYALSYGAQLSAYLFVLTDRYPDSDPYAALEDLPASASAVDLTVGDDLRRSRLTVFFRLPLALPHIVWLYLWGVVAVLAVVVNWVATLIAGRSPAALHRFLAAFLRYETHVGAFVSLTANPFPGFTGAAGSYPVDLIVAERAPQNRWTVAFRIVLAVPALLVASAYAGLIAVTAVLGWFSALARGRMPLGMRNAAALSLRYLQQARAYLFLLTDDYPYGGPTDQAPAVSQAPLVEPPAVA
jgi:Domain of unknown function (DUF4389)